MKYIKQLERMREKHRVLLLVDMFEEKKKKGKASLLTAFYKPPLKEVEHKRIDLTTMANADELLKALRHPLPQVFICGKRVGGLEEINKLNKTGELKPMLDIAFEEIRKEKERIEKERLRRIEIEEHRKAHEEFFDFEI